MINWASEASPHWGVQSRFHVIGERAKTPSIATYRENVWMVCQNHNAHVREAEEWTRVYIREACLLFTSAITKSSLYVRQNYKAHAQEITLLSLAP